LLKPKVLKLRILKNKSKDKRKKRSSSYKYRIHVKITPNNVFCMLADKKRTLYVQSAGILKLQVSQKSLKHTTPILINRFIEKVKELTKLTKKKERSYRINISGPKKIKKRALEQLMSKLSGGKLLIDVKNKKVFNGCRAKKKRKKKGKRLRVFKI
jgi:ribosomal protein S11